MIVHQLPGIPPEFTYAVTTVEEVAIHARTPEGVIVHLKLRLSAQHPGHMAGAFEVDIVAPDPMPAPGDIIHVTLWQAP